MVERSAMRALDAGLKVLEDAMAQGEREVTPRVARSLAGGLPQIPVGAQISDAIEAIFREQAILMADRSGRCNLPRSAVDTSAEVDAPRPTPLGAQEARLLTQRIKAEISKVCLLVAEAHERKAWLALGYATWDDYIRSEIGYSRSRAYELLDQARAIRSIQAAAGLSTIPEISPYAARQLKPQLAQVVANIRRRTAAADTPARKSAIVQEVIVGARSTVALRRAAAARPGDSGAATLYSHITFLAQLPPPAFELIAAVRGSEEWKDAVAAAICWLQSLGAELESSPGVADAAQAPAPDEIFTLRVTSAPHHDRGAHHRSRRPWAAGQSVVETSAV
jgi:hypothetical protein